MSDTRHETRTRSSTHQAQTNANAARQRLDVFVGRWQTEGRQLDSAVGSAATIAATETFEWLSGHAFLIHRFDGRVGDREASCIEIIGSDTETGACRAQTFYNNGMTNVWDMQERDGVWSLLGDWNMGDKAMKVRCTIRFSDNGRTMHALWEHSTGRDQWQTFWDVNARKALSS